MLNLMHGDCLERLKSIPDKSIDMVLTDPPYGTTQCKWDSLIDFDLMWKELKRVTKDNGAICLFGTEPFSSSLRMNNLKMFRYDWVWEKGMATGFLNSKRMPLKAHEIISVFYKRLPVYNPQFTQGESYSRKERKESTYSGYGEFCRSKAPLKGGEKRYPRNVIKFKNSNRNSLHPTQKPVDLLEYFVMTYTNENETVLDFTMGSGSTGVACKNLGRKFVGIEKDESYFQIAKKRIMEFVVSEESGINLTNGCQHSINEGKE